MDFMKLLKDAGKIQEEFGKKQEELEAMTYEGEAGAGMVKVTVNGKQEVVSLTFEEGLMEKFGEKAVSELVAGAVNAALAKSKENAKTGMMQIFQSLGINPPGL